MRCERGSGVTSDEDPLGDRLLAERVEHVGRAARLDVLGELAQRELAQRREVVEAEEVLRAPPRRGRAGRPCLAQPLLERLRGEVDEHDLVGLVEDAVGEGLADADAGQLEHLVVEALEVLDVDRISLDGLTGHLTLDADRRVHRELGWAQIHNGELRILPSPPI